jgi:uncharacterized protein with von Willebrand factor type A (vWA) domain
VRPSGPKKEETDGFSVQAGDHGRRAGRAAPTLTGALPTWRSGDTIPLGKRTFRVLRVRDDDADQPPVLVVEDMAS